VRFSFLQDLDFMSQGGGAQNTDRAHFIEGIRRGHDLNLITPQGDAGALFTNQSTAIISNITTFPFDIFQKLQNEARPYIWFLHDYWPVCKYHLFYPMQPKCQACYLKEKWLPILLGAKLIIWLSPLHRNSWLWACPELKDMPYALVPSPVNPKQFYDLGLDRDGVVAVSSLFPFKGRENVLQWAREHPDQKVTCIGGNPTPEEPLPPNCEDIGPQSFWALNEIYNKHKAFLHLPNTPQPFERSATESYLAGCDIVGNNLIGALSYRWFKSREQVAKHCGSSPKLFWEKVESVL